MNLTVPETSLVVHFCTVTLCLRPWTVTVFVTALHMTSSIWPAGPCGPVGPAGPVAPVVPVGPVGPVGLRGLAVAQTPTAA